jgi:glycosyltransferase involved in cell wall biosynthesis
VRVLVAHPSSELYGSDRVAAESVAAFVEAGWEVVVALSGVGPLTALLESLGARVVVVPAPVLRKSLMSPRGLVSFAAATARAVRPMRRLLAEVRPDVVYVSTVTVPSWPALARAAGARVVCHVHEAEEALPRVVRAGLAAPLLLAHAIVANSELSRDVVVRVLPLLRSRTRVVYNGVPGPSSVAPLRRVLDGAVRLVLVGRVSPRKGTDVAVRALGLLRERGVAARLTLVGGVFPGYEWFEAEVRAEAERLGVTDAVTWAGVLSDVWAALADADVALVPSRVEPFGNAAVEAMLAGRPVVVGATQGLREIVRSSADGESATPGDAAALADAVQRVVDDWPGALARAATARERAAADFGPERYRRDISALIRDAAGRPGTRTEDEQETPA